MMLMNLICLRLLGSDVEVRKYQARPGTQEF